MITIANWIELGALIALLIIQIVNIIGNQRLINRLKK